MIGRRFRCPLLIGRSAEFGALVELAQQAVRGEGSLALVGGEAGIGKTRLIEEWSRAIPDGSMTRSSAACFDTARTPLAPVIDALRGLEAAAPTADEAAPSIRRLLDGDASAGEAGPATSRRDHFFAIVSYLRTRAEAAPLVLCIEDVHWADAETLEFLRFIAPHIADIRMLIVVTYRPGELSAAAFSAWFTAITRIATVRALLLGALSTDDMILFIDEATRGEAALPARIRRQIRLRSEGNPLFAEELLQHAGSRPLDDSLPVNLQSILLERLRGLDKEQRALLETAATFATSFATEDLAGVSDMPHAAVEAALRDARDIGLVAETKDRDAWTFRHNLIRESIYTSVPRSAAARVHLRIAHRLETVPPERRDLLSLAYHWSRAGEREKAAQYCEDAGNRAMQLGASADAAELYERALEAMERTDSRRTALLTKLGTAFVFAALPLRGRDAFEEAMALAVAAGDTAAIAEIGIRLARCLTNDKAARAAIGCLQSTLDLVKDDVRERPAILASLAWTQAVVGATDAALEALDRFDAVAAHATDGPTIEALDARGTVMAQLWRPHEALAAFRTATERSMRVDDGDTRWAVRTFSNFAEAAAGLGFMDQATEAADAAIRIVRGWAFTAGVTLLLGMMARVHLRAGRVGLANTLFLEADLLAIEAESSRNTGHLAMPAFALAARLGDPNINARYDPNRVLADALASEETAWIAAVAASIAEWYAQRGDIGALRAVLTRTFPAITSVALSHELILQTLLHGDPDHRSAALKLLANVRPGESPLNTALVLIRDAFAAGRSAAAKRSALVAAAEQFAAMGMAHDEGCVLELAQDPSAAVNAYRRAGSTAQVARLGAAPAAGKRAAAFDALTRRESEVAALVGSGASNRVIAERIGLSERTVEAHLRSIFSKLDVRSRYELIARMLHGRTDSEAAIR